MLEDYKTTQPNAYRLIKNVLKSKKYSHAYIIEKNGTNEALAIATAFAKGLFCPFNYEKSDNCKNCFKCKRIDDGSFLDLKIIEPDGVWIKKNQLEDLKKAFQTKPIEDDKMVYIINDANKLNASSSNSILKFLEEPESGIVAILIVNNIYELIPTIISRCQIISLNNLEGLVLAEESISNEKKQEMINSCIKFISYYEINHLRILTKTNELFHNQFKEKYEIEFAFQIMLLIYRDSLNIKFNLDIKYFPSNIVELNSIVSCNSVAKICKKIKLINEIKEKIKYNLNTALLLDKLIIELERIRNDD